MARRTTRPARESPYVKFVKLNHLDALDTPGWSGKGSHVEFHSREDVPLLLGPNLGQGSFSVVQRVIRTNADKRPLAQKIIWDYRKGGIEQVMTEVQCIQYLRHRHIVQLVGTYVVRQTLHILLFPVGQWNLRHFLQEFEDERMASKAYPDFYSVGTFFKCLATGVAYLHDEAIPHIINLDIKPENIIVRRCADRRLTVFITDFGVSRSFQPSSPSTDANTLYTTPIYQAPEIAKKKEYGRKADIFSLGCVFSEMASILAGRTLQAYSKYREHYLPGLVNPSIAFESNLPACITWLEELKTLPPFKRPSTGRNPEWWMRLLELVEKMISEDPSERHTSEEVVKAFPQGPCCKVQLEEYEPLQQDQQTLLIPHATTENSSIVTPSPALTSATTPVSTNWSEIELPGSSLFPAPGGTAPAFHEVELAPKSEPEIALLNESSESDSSLSTFDWSGNGAHMQYASKSMVPLELVSFLGMGAASSVHKVKTKHGGSHVFAQKTLQTGRQTLRMEQMIREAKLLQNLRNPHIVRLIGTTYDQRYFSILTYPAAEWNLSDFMSELEERRSSRDALTVERKQALYSFTACLSNALQYLHKVEIKHKDVKPSNILVQRWPPDAAGYHVYLSGMY
jgi:serine/threonine protein kinase